MRRIRLTQAVTVTITAPSGLTVSPTSHIFIAGEPEEDETDRNKWDDPITVTITAAEDDNGFADTFDISHSFAGADYEEGASARALAVTVTDNDTPGLVFPSRS